MRVSSYETMVSFKRVETKQGVATSVSRTKNYNNDYRNVDQLAMTSTGKRMSKLLIATKQLGAEEVKTRLNNVNEKMSSLELESLNLAEMSRSELESKLNEVQEVILEIKPNAEVDLINFEGKSDEELMASLENVIDKVDTAKDEFTTIKEVISNLFEAGESANASSLSTEVESISNEAMFDEVIQYLEDDGSEEALDISQSMIDYLEKV